MASPDILAVGSGLPMYAGMAAPGGGGSSLLPLSRDGIDVGDSITDLSYNSASHSVARARSGCDIRSIFNGGYQAQQSNVIVDRGISYIATFPGAMWHRVRFGTNGAGTFTNAYHLQRYVDAMIAAGKFLIVCAIPPRGLGTAGVDSAQIAENAAYAAICAAAPDNTIFVNDSVELGDANYNAIPSYYLASESANPIHIDGKGIRPQSVVESAVLQTLFAATDPRLTDPTDNYLTTPASNQYIKNPHMAGTAGTVGSGITGTAPTNWALSGYGGGTSAVASVVAAETGQSAYGQQIQLASIVAGGNTHAINIDTTCAHPAIAADATIKRLDALVRVNLVGVDCTLIDSIRVFPNVGGFAVGPGTKFNFARAGTLTDSFNLRCALPRTQQVNAGNSETLAAYSANTLKFSLVISFTGAGAVSGTIKISCASMRGEAT